MTAAGSGLRALRARRRRSPRCGRRAPRAASADGTAPEGSGRSGGLRAGPADGADAVVIAHTPVNRLDVRAVGISEAQVELQSALKDGPDGLIAGEVVIETQGVVIDAVVEGGRPTPFGPVAFGGLGGHAPGDVGARGGQPVRALEEGRRAHQRHGVPAINVVNARRGGKLPGDAVIGQPQPLLPTAGAGRIQSFPHQRPGLKPVEEGPGHVNPPPGGTVGLDELHAPGLVLRITKGVAAGGEKIEQRRVAAVRVLRVWSGVEDGQGIDDVLIRDGPTAIRFEEAACGRVETLARGGQGGRKEP